MYLVTRIDSLAFSSTYVRFSCFWTLIFLLAASATTAQIRINEICPSNGDIIFDPDYYNFPGWIELRNFSSQAVNIGGSTISPGPDAKSAWVVPKGTIIEGSGYLLIWCDQKNNGLHTNFKMEEEGGVLTMRFSNGQPVETINYPRQFTNVSYGRSGESSISWSYLAKPTPGAVNEVPTQSTRLEPPRASKESGRYGSGFEVALDVQHAGASIRYTTDGSDPLFDSPEYVGPVIINKTSTLKAKSFSSEYLPSETSVYIYFIGERVSDLPVVALSTAPDYLWGNQLGIYADGSNGIAGPWSSEPVNWNQDWERHARIDLFDVDGKWQFGEDVGISIAGGFSRTFPQKSFAIKARGKYGDNTLNYPFFSNKVNSRYGGLMLRNGGNDHALTMFRDALTHSLLIDQMDIDYQAYQPAVLFINGSYWGIQNIREKVDGDYVTSNYGLKATGIDLLENYSTVFEGSTKAYDDYLRGLAKLDLKTATAYDYISRHIDVQEYINYMVVQIYVANKDWPGNNVKLWRPKANEGRFRWILIDTDFGFDLSKADRAGASHPTLEFATDPDNEGWPNPAWATYHFRMALENPIFRSRFIETMTTAINVTFEPKRVIHFIDSLQSAIESEMPFHKARWGSSLEDWYKEVQVLRDFAIARNAFMKMHLKDFFKLGPERQLLLEVHPVGEGSIKLGGISNGNETENSLSYFGLNFLAEAVPNFPNDFDHWTISEWEQSDMVLVKQGSEWLYYTQNHPLENWLGEDVQELEWEKGLAPLGYGDGDEKTTLWSGNEGAEKPITHYFRHSFLNEAADSLSYLRGSVRYDDGIVVYLNGIEVYRENLPPDGVLLPTTSAQRNKYGEEIFLDFDIDKALLRDGINWLAAEVHQMAGTSDDIIFDLQLKGAQKGAEEVSYSNKRVISGETKNNLRLEAHFIVHDSGFGVVINELAASKSSTVTDEYGDREDWIELYNAGNTEVNLHGYYITDDFYRKDKFKLLGIDGRLNLAPGKFMLFWADEETSEGLNHLNFKLSDAGEQVGLYRPAGGFLETVDEITFGFSAEGKSFARIPDGTGFFEITSSKTPRTRNALNANEKPALHLYPNPAEGYLYIDSVHEIDEILVFDVLGALVHQVTSPSDGYLNLNAIKPGVYIFKVFSAGQTQQVKVIKR